MKILYMGGGFVGACSAAVSADSGHEVLVFDIDEHRVKKLNTDDRDVIQSCLHEDGLAELLIRNRSRISFVSDIKIVEKFISDVEVVFMCLPTPEKDGAAGETDLSYYEAAVDLIGRPLANRNNGKQSVRVVIVNKSTVPVRMIDYTEELFSEHGVKNFGIVSNPEFLVEGAAIEGSVHPDRVVVGANLPEDFLIMRKVYQRFVNSSVVKYLEVNPHEAASAKLLANFILFSKIVTTFDVVGRVCEYFPNLRYEEVRKILVSEPRIGAWGLYDSLFAGGSCFIKDAGSLAHQLENAGARASLVRGILESNVFQLDHFFGRAETEAGLDWVGRTVAMFGVAFKQGTNDIRNSGGVAVVQQLLGAGVNKVKVFDLAATEECKKYFANNPHSGRIEYCENETETLKDSSVAILCTDWPQFETLGEVFKSVVKPPYLIMDGRRIIKSWYNELISLGFDIIAVGSPFMKSNK